MNLPLPFTKKVTLLCILFFSFCGMAFAQVKLSGQVFENNSKAQLPGIIIENLNSHAREISGHDGSFSIKAKVGDILIFNGPSYEPDTLYIISLKKLQVLLSLKSRQLGEVKVTS